MRCLLSFYVNYARIIKVHPQINKITLKRQKGKQIHSIRCEQTIIIVFVVIILLVILSNLKTSARRLKTLDHFFPTRP